MTIVSRLLHIEVNTPKGPMTHMGAVSKDRGRQALWETLSGLSKNNVARAPVDGVVGAGANGPHIWRWPKSEDRIAGSAAKVLQQPVKIGAAGVKNAACQSGETTMSVARLGCEGSNVKSRT